MKPKTIHIVTLFVILTVVGSLGCNALSNLTVEEGVPPTDPPSTEPIPPTETPEPVVEEEPVERVQLDPCTLLTEDEAGEVLGGSVQIQPSMGTGGCVYMLQTDDPTALVQLALSAAQGNEAKALTVLSLGLLAGFSGDPEIQAGFEEVNSQIQDMTLLEVVIKMAELFRGTGINVIEADAPGEHATWLVYEDDFFSQGTLILVRGDEYVSMTQMGGDMEVAFEELGNLGGTIFDRLPASFYMLDEDGDGSFSLGMGEDSDSMPTVAPEPTLPPLAGCVPQMLIPIEGAVLDNGCSDFSEPIVWDFEWSECPEAQSYALYVTGPNATVPVVDTQVSTTNFQHQSTGYIVEQNSLGWRWKVRAMQNGEWGEWSPEQLFDIEPPDTDCP